MNVFARPRTARIYQLDVARRILVTVWWGIGKEEINFLNFPSDESRTHHQRSHTPSGSFVHSSPHSCSSNWRRVRSLLILLWVSRGWVRHNSPVLASNIGFRLKLSRNSSSCNAFSYHAVSLRTGRRTTASTVDQWGNGRRKERLFRVRGPGLRWRVLNDFKMVTAT